MRDQAVDEIAGGESLAGAGRHLHQRARVGAPEGRFDTVDGLDLAVTESRRGERREGLQSVTQARALLERFEDRGRLVERKESARARTRVPQIPDERLPPPG